MPTSGTRRVGLCTASLRRLAGLLAICGGTTMTAAQAANDNGVILQIFENSWSNIERRMPDIFMSGYGALWLPPPSKASFASAGYDVFDRFDLGQPGSETAYGTEARFRQMVRESQRAGLQVYPDSVLNHNGGRTSDANFIADGGYPGFYLPGNGPSFNPPGLPYVAGLAPWIICGNFSTRASGNYFWGDFHNGQTQSENPGGSNYCLWLGDLVALVDIAQESDYRFIRHPIGADSRNIPPGRTRNLPNANNRRFYPDRDLPPRVFTNPAVPGFSNQTTWTIYPFNTANPMAGDPVVENAAELLMRWSQWMVEDVGVDGFRLDAAKHIKHDFWNEKYDASVNMARTTPAGTKATPFSFGENIDSNNDIFFYTRKTSSAGFRADRDALDINEAGPLRDMININRNVIGGLPAYPPGPPAAQPFPWSTPLNQSLDLTDNGLQDASLGMHHVYSHDNGSVGNGGSAPAYPEPWRAALPMNLYCLFRSGIGIVYHNAREMHDRFPGTSRFWPREGNPTAIGNRNALNGTDDSNWITDMVRLHNSYARGQFATLNNTDGVNPTINSVLVFERRTNSPNQNDPNPFRANVLVGVNTWYGNGFQQRSVQTSFQPGTKLYEQTGVWQDPIANVSQSGITVPQVLTVDGNRRVLITIPNNRNANGVEHNRGYVVYGPARPQGTMTITNVAATIPAEGTNVPTWQRRLTAVDVITAPTFEIRLNTTKADPTEIFGGNNPTQDGAWDDFAIFRINQGYQNFNGVPGDTLPESSPVDGGYEPFVTQFSPIAGPGGTRTVGTYRQVINTSDLPEGFNYISTLAYRRQLDGTLAIFNEWRRVIYVDRLPPQVTFDNPGSIPTANYEFRVTASDRGTNQVYIIPNLPPATDALAFVQANPTQNLASAYDRFEWRRTISNLPTGANSITVVAFELSGRATVQRFDGIINRVGTGDVTQDGVTDLDDLYAHWALGSTYLPEADMNRDGQVTNLDRRFLELAIRGAELNSMRQGQR